MKLYKRVTRLAYLKIVPKKHQERIKWALSLKLGDLINDCSGFNRHVKTITPDRWKTGQGWFIQDIDFLTLEGGCCSLLHCGVTGPKTREYIEKNYLEFLNCWLVSEKGAKQWYGGLDNSKYKEEIDKLMRTWEDLKAGKHICDEFGVLYGHLR